MSKKLILVFIGIIFLSEFSFAFADVIISEVKLSPVSERFIELYNSGDADVDLTGWYMQRKTATGSSFGSLVSKPNFEGRTIGANSYFVISRVALEDSDIVLDSLTLTESNAIQIKNSSEEVVDKVSFGDSSDCSGSCPVNPEEGKSIQKVAGSWIIATPTPGLGNSTSNDSSSSESEDEEEENEDSETEDSTSTSSSSNSSSSKLKSSSSSEKQKQPVIKNSTMKARIVATTPVFANQPLSIQVNVVGLYNENVVLGRAYWNFGDGSSLEQINNFTKFYHTYDYPGEYVVILEYYSEASNQTPDVTSKMTIKVLPVTVSISKVGDAKDFFTQLTNQAISDINISNWVLNARGKIFTLPKNSVIISKKSMTISGRTTGFVFGDESNLKLFSPNGELVFDYGAPVPEPEETTLPPAPILNEVGDGGGSSEPQPETIPEPEEKVMGEDLSATVLSSDIVPDVDSSNSYLFISGLFGLITSALALLYFIGKSKKIPEFGENFEILEDE